MPISISRKVKNPKYLLCRGLQGVSRSKIAKTKNGKRESHDFSEYMIFVRAGRAEISSAALFAKTRNSPKHLNLAYIYVWEDFCDFAFCIKIHAKYLYKRNVLGTFFGHRDFHEKPFTERYVYKGFLHAFSGKMGIRAHFGVKSYLFNTPEP